MTKNKNDNLLDSFLKDEKIVIEGDCVINCASMPIHKKQRTNTIKVTFID